MGRGHASGTSREDSTGPKARQFVKMTNSARVTHPHSLGERIGDLSLIENHH